MDWRTRGACLDEPPELFFPIGISEVAQQQADEAKAICGRCPVREQCLGWALDVGQVHGVWGGTSEMERLVLRAVRRTERATATGTGRDPRRSPSGRG